MRNEPLIVLSQGSIIEQSEGERSHSVVEKRHSLVLIVQVCLEDSSFLGDGQVFIHSEVQLKLVDVQVLRRPSSIERKFELSFVIIQNWLLHVIHFLDRALVVLESDVVRVAILQVSVDLVVQRVPDFVAKDKDFPALSHSNESLCTLDLPHDFVSVQVVEVNCRVPALFHLATTLLIFSSIFLGEVSGKNHSSTRYSPLDRLFWITIGGDNTFQLGELGTYKI